MRRQHPGMDIRDVIVRATAQRLRPVLLTTITTVCGLLPSQLGSVDLAGRSITADGEMAMFWAPLSQDCIWLIFATVLTLVARPRCCSLPGYQDAVFDGQSPISPRLTSSVEVEHRDSPSCPRCLLSSPLRFRRSGQCRFCHTATLKSLSCLPGTTKWLADFLERGVMISYKPLREASRCCSASFFSS